MIMIEQKQQYCIKYFENKIKPKHLKKFETKTPQKNIITGYINKKSNQYLGSLIITQVNGQDVEEKFTRPIDVNEVADDIATYVSTHNSHEKKSILAVDDSGVFLREINSWFSEDYKVALVNSGINAIKYLGSHRPDLILLDYEMPICNGKQVLEMIRSDTECGDIPVMFLTSNGDRDTILDIMPLDVAGYLLKTQSAGEIKKAVDAFLAKRD